MAISSIAEELVRLEALFHTAPHILIAFIIIIIGLIWVALHFLFRHQIENKNSTIENQGRENSLLNNQLEQARDDLRRLQEEEGREKVRAELVRGWPEPLLRDFKSLVKRGYIAIPAHPVSQEELERTANAKYLMVVGFAESPETVTTDNTDHFTVRSSASAMSTGQSLGIVGVQTEKKDDEEKDEKE